MANTYNSVSQTNSTFGNPRQKTWMVMKNGLMGWSIDLTTTSFTETQRRTKELLSQGGLNTSINRIMVMEVVPIDLIITPQV